MIGRSHEKLSGIKGLNFKYNGVVFEVSREPLTIQPFHWTCGPPHSAMFLTEYKNGALF